MSLALVSTSGTFTTEIVEGDKAETIAPIVSGTAVTASGTVIDFTGIPSWVKRVTVLFNGVSLSGTSSFLVQIGSGAVVTTGYSASSAAVSTGVANATGGSNNTTGFNIHVTAAAYINSGKMEIIKVSGNTWVSSHALGGNASDARFGGGTVTLGGVLDRVRITTVNGTDTFDAGTINILWE